MDYSQTIDHVYEKLEDYKPIKKKKVLIVFDIWHQIWNLINDLVLLLLKCFSKVEKTQYFACFYIIILFQSA